jgi:Na+/glutamate symporter
MDNLEAIIGVVGGAIGAIGGRELIANYAKRKADKSDKKDEKRDDIETYWKQQHQDLLLEHKASEQKIKKLEMQIVQIRVAADMSFDLLIKIDPENEPFLIKLKEKINGKLES